MNILAIDIGGTMIKYGLVSSDGEILSTDKIETEAEKGLENILNKIDNIFKRYKENNPVGIAVSGTGQINGMIGKVIGGNPIIPNWIGANLVKILEEKYNLPAILENDVNCVALGEKWIGAGKNLSNFICLTIGTGIGGGVILNNQLFRGENFVAGEFGHILIKKGEFEQFASTTALIRLVKERTGKILNGKEIFDLEKKEIVEYQEVISEWIENLTDGLSSIIYCFNPANIILGGGVIGQGEPLINRIKNSLFKKIGSQFKEKLNIIQAKLGNNAGMIGASYLLLEKFNKR
ncbi:ROK family protein [Fusobacterium vincentii]|uniref:ROK family protein n=1 Tax=Fusobacterium nucleatum TaxID=851 RepID=A0AAX3M9P1_FUSNU|nr:MULTISPECIES: ROK family protein [Fusobacterium]ATV06228.1 ROK family protein [Fusobacterium vincentii]OFL30043.1 N-acetylmannosamine kinase [Fusobacterium sp. HMSC064B12]WDA43668.1 ROK family protein [Fusobacterium nucleatum]BEO93420.1 ROK family protein [Fusobacterium nucleatum]BEP06131.1 ROK family protein [Fusobacterium nucleatum]